MVIRNVISAEELSLGLFDYLFDKPDVRALIDDLGLVPGKPPVKPFRSKFCDLYKAHLLDAAAERQRLCRRFYERNKKFSHYKVPCNDYGRQGDLF